MTFLHKDTEFHKFTFKNDLYVKQKQDDVWLTADVSISMTNCCFVVPFTSVLWSFSCAICVVH
jgi:hypothetical protein